MKKLKRFMRSLFIKPLIVLVALYILFEEFLEGVIKPAMERLSALHTMQAIEGFIHRRNPYTLFLLYVCKLATFFSIKLFSLYLMGKGQFVGAPLLVCGELTGAIITVWYAKVALPSLLTLHWFAFIYNKLMAIKTYLVNTLKKIPAYQLIKMKLTHMRQRFRSFQEFVHQRSKKTSIIRAVYQYNKKSYKI